MAGFFGLFNAKTKYVDDTTESSNSEAENQETFFLNADEAKTIGKSELMRKKESKKTTEVAENNQVINSPTKSESAPRKSRLIDDRFRNMAKDMKKG